MKNNSFMKQTDAPVTVLIDRDWKSRLLDKQIGILKKLLARTAEETDVVIINNFMLICNVFFELVLHYSKLGCSLQI